MKSEKVPYAQRHAQQARGHFRPTSPFVSTEHQDAAPSLDGWRLEKAQDKDEEAMLTAFGYRPERHLYRVREAWRRSQRRIAA